MKENDRLEKLCQKIINGEITLQWHGGLCGLGGYVRYESRLPKVFEDQPNINIECFTEKADGQVEKCIVVQLIVSQDVVAELNSSYIGPINGWSPDKIKELKENNTYDGSEVPGLLLAEVIKQHDKSAKERKTERKKITNKVIDQLLI